MSPPLVLLLALQAPLFGFASLLLLQFFLGVSHPLRYLFRV
jgi:hypothetical protein